MNEAHRASQTDVRIATLGAAFACPEAELLDRLDVDPEHGLPPREVDRRRRRFGKNKLKEYSGRTALQILFDQFRSLIVWLLAAAAALSTYLGDVPEALAIVFVLIINAGIGFFTELRAIRSMESLQRMARVTARVRRGRITQEIDAAELVPGDIVTIEAGDVVPADLRLLEAANFRFDESALTGESTPVIKEVTILPADTVLAEQRNMAFKGTAVSQGAGEGVVVATGMITELGRISKLAHEAETELSPLEKRLERLGHRLIWLMLVLVVMMAVAGVLRGQDLFIMMKTAIALAVAAVPEGLPVIATLCLARGMWRMAQRNAVIARLSAVETLGATTVILTDKTGTLTENRMTATGYLLAGIDVQVETNGCNGPVTFKADRRMFDPRTDERLGWALRVGALCNDAALSGPSHHDRGAVGVGDPMELALLLVARKARFTRQSLLETCPEVTEHAFDPDLQMMATVHRGDEDHLFAVKGAPEQLIKRCDAVLAEDGVEELNEAGRHEWVQRARDAATRGFRLLAFAMKRGPDAQADPYTSLTLVGLVCLLDPLRPDVQNAIDACEAAGVRVIMLTGDHADTAAEIARQAGLGDGPVTVIEGREIRDVDLDNLSIARDQTQARRSPAARG